MLLSFGEAMEREQVKGRGFFGTNKVGFTCEEILSTVHFFIYLQSNGM
jgi:hypothetical protein